MVHGVGVDYQELIQLCGLCQHMEGVNVEVNHQ